MPDYATSDISVFAREVPKSFHSWFWDKIFPVAGDVSLNNLGIGNVDLAEDIVKETNIIIHMAAAVNFRER